MAIVAAAIDTANRADYLGNGLFTLRVPLWESGGALYAAAIHHGAAFDTAAVWRSDDDGATWTLKDDANAPYQCSSLTNVQAGSVVYFLCGARSDQADVALRLYSFDCSTDTWAAIDTAGPSAHWASGLLRRSDGSFIAVYGTFGSGNLFSVSFNGSWGTPQDIGAATGSGLVQFDVWCCIDREDRGHIFIHDRDPMTFLPANWWHVAVETTDLLGSVDLLPDLDLFGGAASDGDNIALGCSESTTLKILIGTPLSAPVFTLSSTIDGNQPSGTNLVFKSGAWGLLSLDNAQQIIRLAQSTDLAAWAVTQPYDETTDATPANADASWGMFPVGAWTMTGQLLLGSNYRNTSLAAFTSFYIGAFPLDTITPTGGRLRNTFE